MKTLKLLTLSASILLYSGNVSFSADETVISDEALQDRFSGPRIYISLGADNIRERRGFDISTYGAIEVASEILNEDYGLRLRLGADVSEVGAWAGVGISTEYVFDEKPFYIEGSFMAGGYTDFGELDLGHALEFRSQVAIGYHFENDFDVALTYAHKSNASIGDSNPGAESFALRIGHAF